MAGPGDAAGEGAKITAGLAKTVEALRRAMIQTLDADGARWEASLGDSIKGPLFLGPGKSVDADLATRSGRLRRSFGHAVASTEQLHGMTGQKYTTSPYALIQEFGGLIKPKNAKMLAIPLPPAMTASGVPRMPNPRAWGKQLFVLRIHGKYFLARKKPRSGSQSRSRALASLARGHGASTRKRKPQPLELMYVLKDHVWITPRLKMRALHEQDTSKRLADFQMFGMQQLQRAFPSGASQ